MELTNEFIETVEDAMACLERFLSGSAGPEAIDQTIFFLGLVEGQLEAMRAKETGNFDTGDINE